METEAMNVIMAIALTAIIIFVAIGLILYVGADVSKLVPDTISQTYEKFIRVIFSASPFNICEAYSNKQLSLQDFQTLLIGVYNGQCDDKHATVTLSFSLSKDEIKKLAVLEGIANNGELIFYNISEPIGTGGLMINGNPGNYPLKLWDTVDIWAAGKPKQDVFVNVTIKGCDPYDDVCDIDCVYRKICDPVCYQDMKKFDMPCNFACVDVNKNGRMDEGDRDNICSLDCYVNRTNPRRAYDPDCIFDMHYKIDPKETPDDVCDPNSNGVADAMCDPDCAKQNHICDPDCNGTAYSGNPKGLKDDDCYVCDKTCTGFCSMACTPKDKDPDCPNGFKGWDMELQECCGNSACGKLEDCASCPADCPGPTNETTCEDFKKVCCPAVTDDEYGCTLAKGIKETLRCSCDTQCEKDMRCTAGHCCPKDKSWNGTACTQDFGVLILALKTNMKSVYSDSQITLLENKINEYIVALGNDNLAGKLLYLDEQETSDLIGSKVNNAGSWQDIDRVVDQITQKFKVKYIVILGGYARFPQAEYGLHGCQDLFPTFQTDDPYGDNTGDGMPDIPVGRIPDPNSGDLNVIINSLNTYIKLHKAGGIDLKDYISVVMEKAFEGCPTVSTGICLNKNAMNIVCYGGKCLRGSTSYTAIGGHKFIVNLHHGSPSNPQEFSNDGCDVGMPGTYPHWISSFEIANVDIHDALWMAIPCYGGQIKNKDRTEDSIVMQFMKRGGALYVGGTLTQMGYVTGTSCTGNWNIDEPNTGGLYGIIIQKIAVGKTYGDAFIEGKKAYDKEVTNDPISCHYRLLHQTLLYGDPTLKIKTM